MSHVPMCQMCGEREVQIVVNSVGAGYCSPECEASYHEDADTYDYDEPRGSYDLSDDAEALASAGYGTDEDYGYYGEEDY